MALIARQRLTKALLMDLESGLCIASNTFQPSHPDKPRFMETVALPEEREAQWQRIRAAGMDGWLCNVYRYPGDHKHWVKTIFWQ